MTSRSAPPPAGETIRLQESLAQGAPTLPDLLERLSEPRWAARRLVVRALADLGDVAVPGLVHELVVARISETRIASAMDALAASVGDPVDALLTMTENGDPAVAADAAQILGRRRSLRAVPALCALAVGEDENVALAAIEGLGGIGSPRAVPTLLQALGTGSLFRGLPCIDALGRIGDPRAIEPLAALLGDPRLAAEAARALGATADPAAIPAMVRALGSGSRLLSRTLVVALDELRRAVASRYSKTTAIDRALHDPDGRATRALVVCLREGSDVEQRAAAALLGLLGDESVSDDLLSMIDAGSDAAVEDAGRALARLGAGGAAKLAERVGTGDSLHRQLLLPILEDGAAARQAARRCLDDPAAEVRREACRFFERALARGFSKALFPHLGDPQREVIDAAVCAIEAIDDDDAPPLADRALTAGSLAERCSALRLLVVLAAGGGVSAVLSATTDGDPKIRLESLRSLARERSTAGTSALLQALSHDDPATRAASARSLGARGAEPNAVPRLIAATDDPDPWVRYYASQALGSAAQAGATVALLARLADASRFVRLAALEALGSRTEPAVLAALQRESEGEEDFRAAALLSLARAGSEDAAPRMAAALAQADAATKIGYLTALGRSGHPCVLACLQLSAMDDDETVRRVAVEALQLRTDEGATEALLALVETRAAAWVQGALAVPSQGRVDTLAKALAREEGPRATVLASALVRMGDERAEAALIAALAPSNTDVARGAASRALRILGTPAALAALTRVRAEDPSPDVRAIAAVI